MADVKDFNEQQKTVDDGIQDIDLSAIRKKRFRIDGDNNKILELNTSDLGIIDRLRKAYPKLQKLSDKAASIKFDVDENSDDMEDIAMVADALKDVDAEMRSIVDELFEAPVSDVCATDGTMYDLFNGKYRFEYIVDTIGGLYETNLTKELKKLSEKASKHTSKYTKKK